MVPSAYMALLRFACMLLGIIMGVCLNEHFVSA